MSAIRVEAPAFDRGDRVRPGRFHPRFWVLTILFEKLKEIVASEWLPPGEKALDYGCGNMPYKPLFQTKFKEYLGADFPGNPYADLPIGPSGELPLDDGTIDCVVSTQVLEHVGSPSAYLSEAYRVLKPGGGLVLSTHGVWRYHPDPDDYWRWTVDGLEMQLFHAGFDVWCKHSVLGMKSCALQLWQDATAESLWRWLQSPYVWLIQSLIGLLERSRKNDFCWDASVYVMLARKGESRGKSRTSL